MTLTKQIQNLTVGKTLPLDRCLEVTAKADQERAESIELLKRAIPGAGMTLESDIRAYIAKYEGTRFDPKAFHYERQPGEQGI